MSVATGSARARPRRVSPVPSLDAEERLQADGFAPLPSRLRSPHRRHRAARPLPLPPRLREVLPVTIDDTIPVITSMVLWLVERISARLGMPAPLRLIRFARASNDGFYTEAGWSAFPFRGRSVHILSGMCVRAGRYGRLAPLVVDLPRDGYGDTNQITVSREATPGPRLKNAGHVTTKGRFSSVCWFINSITQC